MEQIYKYDYWGYCLALSPDDEYLFLDNGNQVLLLHTYFNGNEVKNIFENISDLLIPNPATGNVIIKFNNPISSFIEIELHDNGGKLIEKRNSDFLQKGDNEIQYDVSELLSGIYYITLTNNSYLKTYKLVKE
jgi:hypothetical protein